MLYWNNTILNYVTRFDMSVTVVISVTVAWVVTMNMHINWLLTTPNTHHPQEKHHLDLEIRDLCVWAKKSFLCILCSSKEGKIYILWLIQCTILLLNSYKKRFSNTFLHAHVWLVQVKVMGFGSTPFCWKIMQW